MLAYAEHAVAEGYNAIAIPGFLEYVTFAGLDVYDEDDDHVARAEAMRAAFGPIWQRVHDLGLKVYLRTDMLALTTPLEDYLEEHFDLDAEDPELWDVYAAGLDEVYREMPYLEGVLIRIGEAGSVYDLDGWDYYSDLAVTTVPAVRAMLTAFTDEAEKADQTVIFRTWSVGVGAVGDMHTDPASYDEVLDGIDSPTTWSSRPSTPSATSTPTCRSTTPSRPATSAGSSSCRAAVSSSRTAPCPTTSATSTSRRSSTSWPRTRRSRASGPGPRTAVRGGPGR